MCIYCLEVSCKLPCTASGFGRNINLIQGYEIVTVIYSDEPCLIRLSSDLGILSLYTKKHDSYIAYDLL
jgi:hypothetical protein